MFLKLDHWYGIKTIYPFFSLYNHNRTAIPDHRGVGAYSTGEMQESTLDGSPPPRGNMASLLMSTSWSNYDLTCESKVMQMYLKSTFAEKVVPVVPGPKVYMLYAVEF